MKVLIRSNKGFSLVELMVVVAIIGILAAIAIPNFQRFTAKSKQSEAKSDLAMIFGCERAFQSEWQTYTSSFVEIGYSPTGNMRYEQGFAADFAVTAATLPANYNGPILAAMNTTALYCGANPTLCKIVQIPTAPTTPPTTAGTPTANTFIAAANADIVGGGIQDDWTIDQNKVLSNVVNGLP